MRKLILTIPFILAIFLICSCKYGNDNFFYEGNAARTRVKDITSIKAPKSLGTKYSFAVITDVHYGALGLKDKVPEMPDREFISWIKKMAEKPLEEQISFVLCLGDIADYSTDQQYADYADFVKRIEEAEPGLKVLNTPGNHDMYKSGWAKWKQTCYPTTSFYKFQTTNYSYYSIDMATGGPGYAQLEKLEKEFIMDKNPKIIFTHYTPYSHQFFWEMNDSTERNILFSLFEENNIKMLLCGHLHAYSVTDVGDFKQVSIPSFHYNRQWLYVHVNEILQTQSFELITAK